MAEAKLRELRDQITCSVCLETFKEPVSLHCGHSFCMECITDCWDHSGVCYCPHCRKTFAPRPDLCKNTVLAEVVNKLKATEVRPSPSKNYPGSKRGVRCDACAETKIRAVKSCLTCLASFCDTHIQLHYQIPAWKEHKLIDPNEDLQKRQCTKHHNGLELYCRTDQAAICMQCVVMEHSNHEVVEMESEINQKRKKLEWMLEEFQMKVQQRLNKMEEIRRAMSLIKVSAERAMQEIEKVFTDLIGCIEETCKKLISQIREQKERDVQKANEVTEQLEKEMAELMKRNAMLTELSTTEDDSHFLQTFSSLSSVPEDEDLLNIVIPTTFSSASLKKELSSLKERLKKISQQKIEEFTPAGHSAPDYILQSPAPQSREEFLQYYYQLTMDLNTAHREIQLSDGNKKASRVKERRRYPSHQERFDHWRQVLCREVLMKARCYWEVEWTMSAAVGVAYKEMCRKGSGPEALFGHNEKSWCLFFSDSCYYAWHDNKDTKIAAPFCSKIGIYVDFPDGFLAFYSISDTMTLLYKFDISFTKPLYPGFWIRFDSSVTIC
uniref:Uncharacterized protein n=1 Tax=Erpetoichthys calabaricus TaxID=27687 RepID=A0A8C4XED6_ERPCA